jgi:hypothetical protein
VFDTLSTKLSEEKFFPKYPKANNNKTPTAISLGVFDFVFIVVIIIS